MSEALETRFTQSFQQQAIAEAQENYPHYIEKLQMHPLELVGKELPSIDGSDEPLTFRTPEEVAQWQEAVKVILQREMESSVVDRQNETNEILDVVHSSIQMFQANPDLVPGTKGYNKELAIQFTKLAEPYALRMNGKLTGYSIPVQGLIDRVRAQVSAKPAAAPASTPAKPAPPASKPQAGIPSKAGGGGGKEEDFSPMWKALGITNAPI